MAEKSSEATAIQPTPRGTGREITPLVIADLEARTAEGVREYGEPLRAHNGRDALVDAYQEALDKVQYLRQEIEERDAERAILEDVRGDLRMIRQMVQERASAGQTTNYLSRAERSLDRLIERGGMPPNGGGYDE